MREPALSQAAGLLDLAARTSMRLMAMVCHGDEQAELPLLWMLCAALTNQNYQVTVLDGTKQESRDNPGLEQILDYHYGQGTSSDDLAPWSTLPARQGLQSLAAAQSSTNWSAALQSSPLQGPNAVVIVYAPADMLVELVAQSGVTPLLAFSSGKTSLMTSYLALKRLLINTQRVPTIAHVHSHNLAPSNQEDVVARSLQGCARQFLQVELDLLPIHLGKGPASVQADVDALLQLLLAESVTLDAPWNGMRDNRMAYGTHGIATRI